MSIKNSNHTFNKSISLKNRLHQNKKLDTRKDQGKRYKNLSSFIFLFLLSLCCGRSHSSALILMFLSVQKVLAKALGFIKKPSRSTLNRSLGYADINAIQELFYDSLAKVEEEMPPEKDLHLCIDGKVAALTTTKRAHSHKNESILILTAWDPIRKLSIAVGGGYCPPRSHQATKESPKVISESAQLHHKILPKLASYAATRKVHLTLSFDAAGGSKANIRTLIENNMDYITAVRGNSPSLYKEIFHVRKEYAAHQVYETLEKRHGLYEYRKIELYDVSLLTKKHKDLEVLALWNSDYKCKTVALYKTEYYKYETSKEDTQYIGTSQQFQVGPRIAHKQNNRKPGHYNPSKDQEGKSVRCFILSRKMSPKKLMKHIREHWSVENSLHYAIDTTFKEDSAKFRGNSATTVAILERIALNFIRAYQKHHSLYQASIKELQMQIEYDWQNFCSFFNILDNIQEPKSYEKAQKEEIVLQQGNLDDRAVHLLAILSKNGLSPDESVALVAAFRCQHSSQNSITQENTVIEQEEDSTSLLKNQKINSIADEKGLYSSIEKTDDTTENYHHVESIAKAVTEDNASKETLVSPSQESQCKNSTTGRRQKQKIQTKALKKKHYSYVPNDAAIKILATFSILKRVAACINPKYRKQKFARISCKQILSTLPKV